MDSDRPVVMSYVATFLPQEAWHIYRQVCGIRKFRNSVVCRRRELAEQFPYEDLHRLSPPFYRALWRAGRRLLGKRASLTPSEVTQLLQRRTEIGARLVHVYLGNEAMRALEFLKRESVPKIVSFHGADLARGFDPADFRVLDPVVDLFLCRSTSLQKELEARGCRTEKIRIQRTGVPVGEYPEKRSQPGEQIRLLQACRFIGKKGIDCSIRAVHELRKRGLDCRLRLAGDGPELEPLKALAQELGLVEFVEFLGFLDQNTLRQEMEQAHIFLHPSRVTAEGDREGIPNSLLEAMAAGLPVVATAHSGIPEAVENGVEGLLTPENDVGAIAEAITQVLAVWKHMSRSAYARVQREYSTTAAAEKLESIYAEVMSK